jgi:hypothetical protein
MLEGTYRINFYYNSNITGHISGQYTTPDNRYGLETITVDEYYFDGSMNNFTIEYSTDTIYNIDGYDADNMDWLVAVASAKTDLVFDFGNYMELSLDEYSFVFSTVLLRHVNNKVTLRFRANNIILDHYRNISVDYNIILILDCETLTSNNWFYSHGITIITDRLKDINCLEFGGNIGIYNLNNLEHIGKHSFKYAALWIVDQSILPNETVYNFEPTIVKGEYKGIQVLKQWHLIKFADNCIIEDEAFEDAQINITEELFEWENRDKSNIMFDLCNISNESGKDIFKNFGNKVIDKDRFRLELFKIKNTIRTDFFGELYKYVYAYCEDEQFLRTVINKLIRPAEFVVQAVQDNDQYDNLTYNLKYTPNINTNVTLCCDVNCLEYGVGHYTAEMTDDLNIDHKTLCVGYDKTNKYYRIKEEEQ